MFNRRQIREKVLQALYAAQTDEGLNLVEEENALIQAITNAHESYFLLLGLLTDVCQYNLVWADDLDNIPSSKGNKTLAPRTLGVNPLIVALVENQEFVRSIGRIKARHFDTDLIRDLFLQALKLDKINDYLSNNQHDDKAHRQILLFLLEEVLYKSEALHSWFEAFSLGWKADEVIIFDAVTDTLRQLKLNKVKLAEITRDWKTDKDFVVRLFRKTKLMKDDYYGLIAARTPNWEADRISSIDMLLLCMAAAELEFFEEIPVKVTLNEYIELAKEYGTPKSKIFVNGVLDNLTKHLKETGRINKSGRGLID